MYDWITLSVSHCFAAMWFTGLRLEVSVGSSTHNRPEMWSQTNITIFLTLQYQQQPLCALFNHIYVKLREGELTQEYMCFIAD